MEETYEQWSERISKLSDEEISIETQINELDDLDELADLDIGNMDFSDIDFDDFYQEALKAAYEYFKKNIKAGKNIDIDLLKIYLTDIKGYDVKQINIYQILLLLSFCGININVNK